MHPLEMQLRAEDNFMIALFSMISIVLVWLGGVAFVPRPGLSLVLTALGSGWTGMLVAVQIRYVQAVLRRLP